LIFDENQSIISCTQDYVARAKNSYLEKLIWLV
jgi:hypothetical protein